MALLALHSRRGPRLFERVVIGLVADHRHRLLRGPGRCARSIRQPRWPGLVPRFEDAGSVLLAASILGATVMPHAIYAHSALTRDRFGRVAEGPERRRILKATRVDVTIALAIAGTVNLVILLLAAATLEGVDGTDTLRGCARGDRRGSRPGDRDALRGRAARIRARVDLGRRLRGSRDHAGGCCTCASRSSGVGS